MRANRFIYLLFAVSVIVLAWLGNIYVDDNSRSQAKYTEAVEHTYTVIINLRYCEKLLLEAESRQEGFLLTRDQHFRDAAEQSLTGIDSVINTLAALIRDNPRQRVNLYLLKGAIKDRLALLRDNWQYVNRQKEQPSILLRSKLIMDKVHLYIRTMENEENDLLLSRNMAKHHYQSLNVSFLKYVFLLACLICLLAIALIVRELGHRVRTQKKLEKSILDLKRSYEEIEQITFTASHDLQEPLRKIRTLTTLFSKQHTQETDKEQKDILARIDRSTEKMHTLIKDLVDFTTLLETPEHTSIIDLNKIFAFAWEEVMKEKEVILTMDTELPFVRGHETQLKKLLTELLTNAWTFRNKAVPLEVTVTCRLSALRVKRPFWQKDIAPRFYEITITDNGIGFDNAFHEKIFVLFQRLHNLDEYPGKGAGLAMVKRIMTNHYGYAEASGEPGSGASFRIYFPVK